LPELTETDPILTLPENALADVQNLHYIKVRKCLFDRQDSPAVSAAAYPAVLATSLRLTRAWDRRRIDGLELEHFLVDALDLVRHNDPTVENAGLIDAALFGHSRRQLFANAAIAASRVAA
jgi:hypothetical protein